MTNFSAVFTEHFALEDLDDCGSMTEWRQAPIIPFSVEQLGKAVEQSLDPENVPAQRRGWLETTRL